jgi:hypothetical protein
MRCKHIPVFVLLALLVTVTALAAPAPEHRGAPTAVSGTYSVTFTLNIASTLPASAAITCKVQVAPIQSLEQMVPPTESATGIATFTGSSGTCAVEIPFSWTLSSPKQEAALSYEIDAFNAQGSLPAVVRTSLQQGIAVPLPASGGTASVALNVTF